MKPDITVIIPSFNHLRYIDQAIDSVLQQEEVTVELIVIDDASTDGSQQHLAQRAARDRFRLIQQPQNRGLNPNLVQAFNESQGHWIAVLASDDYFVPGKLRRQLELVRSNNWDGMYAGAIQLDRDGTQRRLSYRRFVKEIALGKAVHAVSTRDVALPLSQSGLFSRRIFQETLPLRSKYKLDDWAFLIETFRHYRMGFVDEPAFVYRIHDSNTHSDSWGTLPMRMDVACRLVEPQYRNENVANLFVTHASHLAGAGKYTDGLRYYLAAQMISPNLDQLVRFSKHVVAGLIGRHRVSTQQPSILQAAPVDFRRMPPSVSVGIITYNGVEFVEQAVRSALDQEYEHLQVVVADDASTDGTADRLKELAAEYGPRLKLVLGTENLGVTGNSNRMLTACDGDLIAIQGGDDVLLPGKISAQVSFMQAHPECALSYHEVEVFDSATDRTLYYFSEGQTFEGGADVVVEHGTFFCATSVMVRRECIPPERFDERIPVASDWLFWVRTLEKCNGRILWMPGVYARYRRHDRNVTHRKQKADYTEHGITLDLLSSSPQLQTSVQRKRTELAVMEAVEEVRDGQPLNALRALRRGNSLALGIALIRVARRKRLLEKKRARFRE